MRKINKILAGLVILLLVGLWQWPDKKLHLVFCNVGQGNATLITYKTTQILVDAGPDNSVLSCLGGNMPFWDRTIEVVLLTHNQKDHSFGLKEVSRRYQIGRIVNEQFNVIDSGKLEIRQVLGAAVGPENTAGRVFLGKFGQFKFLITGDISAVQEQDLLALIPQVQVLAVAHHGSKSATSQKFLDKIKPLLAVISVGKNSYGHPAAEVLERLRHAGTRVLRTDKNGEVKILSDGATFKYGLVQN
jgi:competence protein ComEC